jgi:prepilin-type N-terminal cleavage/methylation domain-containing protein
MTPGKQKAGFTVVEVLMAMAISSLILVAVLGAFLWSGERAYTGMRVNWSRQEAMSTATKLKTYIRNASQIIDIDVTDGLWVDLGFPDGSVRRLLYSNGTDEQRDGRLYLLESSNGVFDDEPTDEDLVVVRGMTAIFSDGYSEHVFRSENSSYLRVAYRISEPSSEGVRATDDAEYAVLVRFGVNLRNNG